VWSPGYTLNIYMPTIYNDYRPNFMWAGADRQPAARIVLLELDSLSACPVGRREVMRATASQRMKPIADEEDKFPN